MLDWTAIRRSRVEPRDHSRLPVGLTIPEMPHAMKRACVRAIRLSEVLTGGLNARGQVPPCSHRALRIHSGRLAGRN
jgi:hypothetical protein